MYVQDIRHGKRDLIHGTLRELALMLRPLDPKVALFEILPRQDLERRCSIAGKQTTPSLHAGKCLVRLQHYAGLHGRR